MEDLKKAQCFKFFEIVDVIPERYNRHIRLGCCWLCKVNYLFTSVSHIYKHLKVAHPEIAKKQETINLFTKLVYRFLDFIHCKAECALCHSVFYYRTSKDLLRHLKIAHNIDKTDIIPKEN